MLAGAASPLMLIEIWRAPDTPHDPSNRRISVIVHYIEKTGGENSNKWTSEHKEETKSAEGGENNKH